MRASPRERSAARGCALVLAVALAGAGGMTGTASAGSTVEGRALAAARQAAVRAQARTQKQDAAAGTIAAAPVPAKSVAPGKPAVRTASTIPARPAAAGKPAAAVAPATRAPLAGKPPAGPGRGTVVAVAASMRPAMNPVPSASPSAARLDDQVTYQYNALGRRDPFMPLVGGRQYVPIEAPPEVGGLQVVGIVWGAQDKFAITEDGRGNSTVLRPGDKVMNGVVQGLKRDGVIVDLTVDGQTQSVTIPLTRKGEPNANR
jgi:hypothetical protein